MASFSANQAAPGVRWRPVVNDAPIPAGCRSLYIPYNGDVEVVGDDGASATFENVMGGTILPVAATKVLSSGTSVSGIIAIY